METLRERLDKLPKNSSFSEIMKAMSEWEKEAVEWHRGAEARVLRKGLSGRLHPICNPFRSSNGSLKK